MKNFNVTLRWDKELKSSVVFIGSDGIGHVDAVLGATAFAMVPGPRIGKEPGRIAYIDCNKGSSALFSIQEVLDKGVVPENACTSKNLKPTAGEVVFWGLPRHWWQLDLQ